VIVSRALFTLRAALTAAAGALVVLGSLVTLALVGVSIREHDERTQLEREISVYRAQADGSVSVDDALTQLERQIRAAPELVHDSDAAPTAAQMQIAVQQITASLGGEVRSEQALPVRRMGAFDVISVQYDLTLPPAKLGDFFYAVETHAPYLFVGSADIVAPLKMDSGSIFDVQCVLHTYRWSRP
jgi:hypothetical protein